jgi:hypothetical protein
MSKWIRGTLMAASLALPVVAWAQANDTGECTCSCPCCNQGHPEKAQASQGKKQTPAKSPIVKASAKQKL